MRVPLIDGCPAPGMYYDVPFEEYASWRCINGCPYKWSDPKHFHAAVTGALDKEDTDPMRFGRAMHCYVLERETFSERIPIAQPCSAVIQDKKSKNFGERCGKAGWKRISYADGTSDWFCGITGHAPPAADAPRDFATPNEIDSFESIHKALHESKFMAQFKRPGWSEVSIVFDILGFKIKCRLDRYCGAVNGSKSSSLLSRPLIIDLKKCAVGRATEYHARKAIVDYGYGVKSAVYRKAIEAHTGVIPEFLWMFVEDSEPHDTLAVFANDDDLEVGWTQVTDSLQMYRDALQSGNMWGAMGPQGIDMIKGGFPQWKLDELRREHEKRLEGVK